MTKIKANKLHKLGNMVHGLCHIVDGVVFILTLGNISSNTVLKFSMYRRTNNFLYQRKD